jgi:hypothetical protein
MSEVKEKNLSRHTVTLERTEGVPLKLITRRITSATDDELSAILRRHEVELKGMRDEFPEYFHWQNMPVAGDTEKDSVELQRKRQAYLQEHAERIDASIEEIKRRGKEIKRSHLIEVCRFMIDPVASGLSSDEASATIECDAWWRDQDLGELTAARDRFRDALGKF